MPAHHSRCTCRRETTRDGLTVRARRAARAAARARRLGAVAALVAAGAPGPLVGRAAGLSAAQLRRTVARFAAAPE